MEGPAPQPLTSTVAPLHGARLALATVALAGANFMEVLDTTIANVAIPHISGDLGVSPSQGTWVITSYAVANAISVLTAGFLALRIGSVRLFTAGIILFTIASVACGLAHSFPQLVAFRVFQGAVSGLMVPLSQALIMLIYPPKLRPVGLAVWAMTVMIAPILGPILGGWLTDTAGWKWIFFINLPFGIIFSTLTWTLVSPYEPAKRRVPVDWTGLALIVVWVGSLQILLDKGNELDWFGSPTICGLAATAGVGFALFLAWELWTEHPIVDLHLFLRGHFAMGTLALSLGFAVFFASIVILPLWLQTQVGYTATWAGLVMAPAGILGLVAAPIVGRNLHRVDPRIFATAAFVVYAFASWLRSHFTAELTVWDYALPQLVLGLGSGLFFPPLINMALTGLPQERVPFASGLINFSRLLAGGFATAIGVTVWDHRAAAHQAVLVERAAAGSPAWQSASDALTGAGLDPAQAAAVLGQETARQATTLAVLDLFTWSIAAFLVPIAAVWLARRPHDPHLHPAR